jgi:hypothetical protein
VHRLLWRLILVLVVGAALLYCRIKNPDWFLSRTEQETVNIEDNVLEFENGIHLATGFKQGEGLELVIVNCTPCHSAKLVTQNRATKEGWLGIIKWMQATQNLWDLGENEIAIVNYLAKHYATEEKGRRTPLNNIEWYALDK